MDRYPSPWPMLLLWEDQLSTSGTGYSSSCTTSCTLKCTSVFLLSPCACGTNYQTLCMTVRLSFHSSTVYILCTSGCLLHVLLFPLSFCYLFCIDWVHSMLYSDKLYAIHVSLHYMQSYYKKIELTVNHLMSLPKSLILLNGIPFERVELFKHLWSCYFLRSFLVQPHSLHRC